MQMKYTGRGRLLEDGHYHYPGGLFQVDDRRAEQLLDDPHVSVEVDEAGYAHLTRVELNELARDAGVSDPEALPNKQAVIDSLNDAHTEAEAESGEGHSTPSPEEDS